jgi:hypothetical protein
MQGMPVNRDDNGLWCGARNLRRRKAEIAAVSEVQGQGFDEMKRAQVDKVVSILEDWARWQRAYSVFLGAPRRSLGFDLGGSAVTAESGEQNREVDDRDRCRVVDACIDSLKVPAQKAAIIAGICALSIGCAITSRRCARLTRRFWWRFWISGC